MERLQFSTDIRAPKEKVWEILWNDQTYPQWTSVFGEGSHAVSDWQQGSRVEFLGGEGSGMYSMIDEMRPNELMSFRHLGEIKNGQDQPASDWTNAMEIYRLEEADGGTRLVVDLDGTGEFKDYFSKTVPQALAKVKELAEN
jgi:uncharacterized protein YndB with AHSA1/START domain